MLEKAFEELHSREDGPLDELSPVVAITKGHIAIRDGFDAAVGERNTEDVAAKIFKNLLARTGVLGVNDPFFLPDLGKLKK